MNFLGAFVVILFLPVLFDLRTKRMRYTVSRGGAGVNGLNRLQILERIDFWYVLCLKVDTAVSNGLNCYIAASWVGVSPSFCLHINGNT